MRHLPVISLLALSVGLAQAEPVQLHDSTVLGQHQSDPTAPTLAEKRAELARIPGGAGLVDAETYKSGRSSTLQDTLGLAPGVFVQPRFGAEEARLSIRGSGLQRTFHQRGILLLQDGVPINLADGSGDFQAIEPLALEHIEVLRGANAWRHGAANLGGALNFVTPNGRSAAPVDLRFEGGSFAYRRLFAALAEDFGAWDAYLSVSDSAQDGFREHAEQANQRYFANLGGRINERLATRLYLSHVATDSELPGNLSKAQLRDDPEQAAAGSLGGDHKRDFRLNRIGNLTSLELGAGHRLELASYYSEKALWHPIFQVLDVNSEDYGLRLTHKWANAEGWRWQAGVEAAQGRNWDSRYRNLDGHAGRKLNELHQTARNLNLFSELEVPLAERWALLGGLTWLHQQREVDDRLQCNAFVSGFCLAQDESFAKTYQGRVARLGLRHELGDGLQLFANLSQSFEPPTFSELSGGAIVSENQAQQADTLELGLRLNRAQLALDLALYRSQIRDELIGYSDPNNPTSVITTNAERSVHQGVELGAEWRLAQFVLRGQYLLNDFRFDDDPTYGDNRIAGVPSQFLKGEALWQQDGWYAGPTFEWVPLHYAVDHAASLYAEGYAIWGLKGGYRPSEGLGFFVEGRNLADKTYVATTGVVADAHGEDAALFLPGDGRSLYAGLEWRL